MVDTPNHTIELRGQFTAEKLSAAIQSMINLLQIIDVECGALREKCADLEIERDALREENERLREEVKRLRGDNETS